MRGLIYKEVAVFYKCMDKKMLGMAAAFSLLLLYSAGIYGGLMASVMLAMTIGAQNVISYVSDDKAHWKWYEMAMPVSSFHVVASKYISVICTLGFGIAGSLLFNLISSVCFQAFDGMVWGLSVFAAVFIPLFWTGLCLPLTYWFGVQSAQALGLFFVIPVFYMVKYFEDGAGISLMTGALSPYILTAGTAAVVLFALSLAVSTAGYARRK
ncbi:MAG: ABC-2 transporter permease [Eubacterium sp.]|nr:ABC-2 transporter permease [Eubacterium sp.]